MSELNIADDQSVAPPPPPAPPSSKKIKGNRITYSGDTAEVYGIWLLNALLTVLTLGIYSFWGKTRLRRYVTASFSLANDHFEYTGTARELLMGFLKVLPFAILYIVLSIYAGEEVTGVYALVIALLIPFAIYLSMRYRLNRLTWRGIRGRLQGNAVTFALLFWGRYFLNFVTLGYLIPASDMRMFAEVTNNATFGSLRMRFRAKPSGKLIRLNIVTGIIALVLYALLVMGFWAILLLVEGSPLLALAASWLYISVMLGLMAATRGFYQAQLRKEQLDVLRLGDLRFRYLAKGMDVAKLRFGNFLLTLLTLGLGRPLVIQRNMCFLAQYILIGGDLDHLEMLQAARDTTNIGEGMDDLMGLDADLGI